MEGLAFCTKDNVYVLAVWYESMEDNNLELWCGISKQLHDKVKG